MKTKYNLIHDVNHPSHPYNVKLLFSTDGNNWYYTGFGHFFKTKEEAIGYIKNEEKTKN